MLVSGWKIRPNCKLNAVSKWLQKQNITFCLFEQQITAHLIYNNQIHGDKKAISGQKAESRENGELFLNEYRVSVWGDEKF